MGAKPSRPRQLGLCLSGGCGWPPEVQVIQEGPATFRRLVPYPHGTAAEMPDETYVRNVVEIVLASTAPRGRSPAEIAETNIVSA